jgi:hypothetical protein
MAASIAFPRDETRPESRGKGETTHAANIGLETGKKAENPLIFGAS